MTRLIFVYGTLKRGYGNNRILQDHIFVDEGVVYDYKAYDCGFPVARASKGDSLLGEVWDIEGSNSTLVRLDRLESEGSMYHRRPVKVHTSTAVINAEIYVGDERTWAFDSSYGQRLKQCSKNKNGHYFWERQALYV